MKNLYCRFVACFLVVFLTYSGQIIGNNDYYKFGITDNDVEIMMRNIDTQFAYLPNNVKNLLLNLVKKNEVPVYLSAIVGNIAAGDRAIARDEIIELVTLLRNGDLQDDEKVLLESYYNNLIAGEANLVLDGDLTKGSCNKNKCKVFCTLFVSGTLTANNLVVQNTTSTTNLVVGGVDVTSFLTNLPVAQYARIYNTTAQTVAVEGDVTFDTNSILTSGITHTPGTAQVTIVNAGVYVINFSVLGLSVNQFTLFANGVPLVDSTYAGAAGSSNNGVVIETLAAGTVITLRNHTSAGAIVLPVDEYGTQANVNASLLISRINL